MRKLIAILGAALLGVVACAPEATPTVLLPTIESYPTFTPTATPTHSINAGSCAEELWTACWERNGGPWPDVPGSDQKMNFSVRAPESGHFVWRIQVEDTEHLFHQYKPVVRPHQSAQSPSVRTYTCGPEYNDRCWGTAYPASVGAEAAKHGRYSRSGNWVTYTWTRSNGEVVRVREWAPP